MLPRLLIADAQLARPQVRLGVDQAHHVVRVLRMKAGDPLQVFDGAGHRFAAVIEEVFARDCVVRLLHEETGGADPQVVITLVLGLMSAEKMDWAIEKAVELGVWRIVPVSAARSVARLDGARAQRRQEHWERIVVAACKQSGRDRLPAVDPLTSLEHWLAGPAPAVTDRLLLAPDAARAFSAWQPSAPGQVIEVLSGPEAGLTDDEARLAVAAGYVPLRLGPRTLRAETAPLAVLAALQAKVGDF